MQSKLQRLLLTFAALSASFAWAQQAQLNLAGSLRHPATSSTSGFRSEQIAAVAAGNRLATLSALPGSFEVQARVYARIGGVWRLEAQWAIPNPTGGDVEIELYEDTFAVSTRERPDSFGVLVRLYTRTAAGWQSTQTLSVPAAVSDASGTQIRASALSNDLLALAIRYPQGNNGSYNEIVAVVRNGSRWSLGPRAEINDLSDTAPNSMAASGRRVAIGFPAQNAGLGVTTILELGTDWQPHSELRLPAEVIRTDTQIEGGPPGCFGCALAWDGERLAVGDESRERAWVYREQDGAWQVPAGHTLEKPANTGDLSKFGSSVALRGDMLLVGHPNRQVDTTVIGGAVAFRLVNGVWQRSTTLADLDNQPDDYGRQVVIGDGFVGVSDTGVITGDFGPRDVPQIDLRSFPQQGFWTRELILSSPDGVARDFFGGQVAADGPDRLLVSAPGAENALNLQHGRIFYYERRAEQWVLSGELPTPPEFDEQPAGDGHLLGQPIVLRGNIAMVAATGYDHPVHGRDIGAVFVYEFALGQWQIRQRILAPTPQAGAQFGSSVVFDRIDANRVVIAAHLEDVAGRAADTGRAYLYRFESDRWQLQQRIEPPVFATAGERMGSLPASMVLIGHRLYISSWGFSASGTPFSGIVRVYRDLDSGPTLDYEIYPQVPNDFGYFGTSIATESTTPDSAVLYVGAPQAKQNDVRTGSLTRVSCFRDIIAGFSCTQQTLPNPSGVREGDWYGFFVDARFGSVLASAALASSVDQPFPQLGASYLLHPGTNTVQRLAPPPPDFPAPTRFGDHAAILSGDTNTGVHQIVVAAPRYFDRVDVAGYYPEAAASGRVWFYDAADRVFRDGFE